MPGIATLWELWPGRRVASLWSDWSQVFLCLAKELTVVIYGKGGSNWITHSFHQPGHFNCVQILGTSYPTSHKHASVTMTSGMHCLIWKLCIPDCWLKLHFVIFYLFQFMCISGSLSVCVETYTCRCPRISWKWNYRQPCSQYVQKRS